MQPELPTERIGSAGADPEYAPDDHPGPYNYTSSGSNMNILCVADYFLPGFRGGGPITTLANMRKQLAGKINLCVFTRDRDLGSNVKYSGIKANQWLETSDGPIYYAGPREFGARGLRLALLKNDFDIIYLNSFFSFRGSIALYVALKRMKGFTRKKVLIAPRGEFSPGALSIRRQKKKVFIFLSKIMGLYREVFWHASTTGEADDIRRVFSYATGRIFIAADPVFIGLPGSGPSISSKKDGCLAIAFISRISPMKNLDGLIQILSTVSISARLDIFGPIEDEAYWEHCTRLIANLPENIHAAVHGPVSPESVTITFSKYDLFVFPTHGENFGHVIFESLRAGTPVVTSDQTPWEQDEAGALTVIPLDDAPGWREAIESAANRTVEAHERIRQAARRYANRYAERAGANDENYAMFSNVMNFGFTRKE